MEVEAVLAVAINGAIGRDGDIPWHLADDMAYFKKLTSGHAVVMGRKTYESIGKALPNRVNIVLSSNPELNYGDALVATSPRAAIETVAELGVEKLFVIGGPQVWLAFEDQICVAHLTRVIATPASADTFFQVPMQWYKWKHQKVLSYSASDRNDHDFVIWRLERDEEGSENGSC